MFELREIPKWMEQFIPQLTDGAYTTKEELVTRCANPKSWEMATIVSLNSRMAMLETLYVAGLLKVS